MTGIVASTSLAELVSELMLRYESVSTNEPLHNSMGFNSDEFKLNVDVCYYGCSFTYGEGVDRNQRWTDVIDYKQGYSSNNFGIRGVCIDDILSIFVATTKFIKMKKALFLFPDCARQTFPIYLHELKKSKFINIYPGYPTFYTDIAKTWFSLPDLFYEDKTQSAINLITHIANLNNIDLYFSSWSPTVFKLLPQDKRIKNYVPNDNLGSDGAHPGSEYHNQLAQKFIDLL